MKTLKERFEEKYTIQESGCWLWTGGIQSAGYGMISRNGKVIGAHIVSYEMFVGPVPKGYDVEHKCGNRPCVNYEHLQVTTRSDNMKLGSQPHGSLIIY